MLALLLTLGSAGLEVVSALSAFASAGSRSGDSRKAAAADLVRFAQTRSDDAYGQYLSEIALPLAVRAAHATLDSTSADADAARRALVSAGVPAGEAQAMVTVSRRYGSLGLMSGTTAIWNEMDSRLDQLESTARELRIAVKSGKGGMAEVPALLARIRSIDRQLAPLEETEAASLLAAKRQFSLMLLFANLILAAALLYVAYRHARRLIRQQEAFGRELRASEERFEHVAGGANDGIWEWRLGNADLHFSPRCEELLGHGAGSLRETVATFLRRIHPRDRKRVIASLRKHLARGDAFELEFRIRTADRMYRWFRTRGRAGRGAEGKPERIVGALSDVSDRKRAEAQLLEENEKAQATLASIAEAVITVDSGGLVEFINPVAERLTGWRSDEARGVALSTVFSMLDESTGKAVPDPVSVALREGRIVKSEGNVVLQRRSDAPIAIDYSAAAIRDRTGSSVGAVLVFHDMSKERQYATRLAHLASHDALTGLLNRRGFEYRLNMVLAQSHNQDCKHAVLYLDLDQFKVVNDTCGHAAGDELLRQVGALLRPRLREGDTIARLGGDEFGVLLEHCPPEPALRLAEGLRNAIGNFHFVWQARVFSVGVSIGLVNISDCLQTLASVLSAADSACYTAKDKGRNRVQVYSPEGNEVALRQGEMEWVDRIHQALAGNRFCLHAQRVQRTQGNDISPPYTELLLRLRDDQDSLVPPIEFIPSAERYHLMPAIDRWVVTTAFVALAQQFQTAGNVDSIGICGINLSATSVGDDDFLDFVHSQFAQFNIPHACICFEITETTALTSLSKATTFIQSLRALGCKFALDDFGVGASSFAYLKNLPVDYVKIDGSFIKDMLQDPVGHAMVEAIHRIAHIMGKKTIAESVESRAILNALKAIGVDYAQGFAIATPTPFGETRAPPRGVPLRIASG